MKVGLGGGGGSRDGASNKKLNCPSYLLYNLYISYIGIILMYTESEMDLITPSGRIVIPFSPLSPISPALTLTLECRLGAEGVLGIDHAGYMA